MRRVARIARLVTIAVIVAIGVNSIVWAIADWHLADMHVYQDAALRLRAGEQLYGGDVDTLSAYRYAPWFAYAWVPLTLLPQPVIDFGWSAFLLAGSAITTWLVVRPATRPRVALALLVGPILFGISAIGNLQGPMLALLMIGMPRRWAGLAIGLAASLKVVPLLLVLALVAERRWTQAAIAVTTSAILWAPVLWMGAEPITLDPGLARTLPVPVWLLVAGAAVSISAFLTWQRSRYSALAAAAAALLALPRLFVYDITLLVVATFDERRHEGQPMQDGRSDHRAAL